MPYIFWEPGGKGGNWPYIPGGIIPKPGPPYYCPYWDIIGLP